jgi:hypothetical protein
MKGYLRFSGFGFFTIMLVATRASAAVINTCDEANLRTAMANGGTIIFNCSGTIVLGSPLVLSENTVLDGREHNVVISGNDQVRIFAGTNKSLVLYNLTLTRGADRGTNGALGQPGGSAGGGAVILVEGSLHADGCYFLTNRAIGGRGADSALVGSPPMAVLGREGGNATGGAIMAQNAMVTLTNCIFRANATQGGAGGLWMAGGPITFAASGTAAGGAAGMNGGTLLAESCRFENGSANKGGAIDVIGSEGRIERCGLIGNSASWGGAIYCSAPMSSQGFGIMQSTFQSNRATRGGAILHADGNLNVTGCTFNGNAAVGSSGGTDGRNHYWNGGDGEGGGIYSAQGNLLLARSTFFGNQAIGGEAFIINSLAGSGRGGGLYSASAALMENCTFFGNQAAMGSGPSTSTIAAEGGGIFATGPVSHVSFSTIASNAVVGPGNPPARGGGCMSAGLGMIFDSSILAGNTVNGGFGGNAAGSITSASPSYNLSSDETGPDGSFNVDPKLHRLADNGGPVPTMALRWDSVAIDGSSSANHPPTDARGVRRPKGVRSDVGAYEQTFLTIMRSAGGVRITYEAPPTEQYALEVSADLVSWQQVGTAWSDDAGRVLFDIPPPLLGARSYRIRFVP